MRKIFSVLIILTLMLSSMSFVFANSLGDDATSDRINQGKFAFTDAQINQMINDSEMKITEKDISRMANYNQMTADYVNITPFSSGGKTLSITLYQQPTPTTCGPTSAQMVLKFLTGTKYSIDDLISIEGASADAVAALLNKKLGTSKYTYTNVSNNVNALFNNTIYSIDKSIPVIYNILPSKTLLPNYASYTGSVSTGHYIVGYGYSWGVSGTAAQSTVYYADPHYSTPYGKYQTTAQNMSQVVTNRNGYMVTAK